MERRPALVKSRSRRTRQMVGNPMMMISPLDRSQRLSTRLFSHGEIGPRGSDYEDGLWMWHLML